MKEITLPKNKKITNINIITEYNENKEKTEIINYIISFDDNTTGEYDMKQVSFDVYSMNLIDKFNFNKDVRINNIPKNVIATRYPGIFGDIDDLKNDITVKNIFDKNKYKYISVSDMLSLESKLNNNIDIKNLINKGYKQIEISTLFMFILIMLGHGAVVATNKDESFLLSIIDVIKKNISKHQIIFKSLVVLFILGILLLFIWAVFLFINIILLIVVNKRHHIKFPFYVYVLALSGLPGTYYLSILL